MHLHRQIHFHPCSGDVQKGASLPRFVHLSIFSGLIQGKSYEQKATKARFTKTTPDTPFLCCLWFLNLQAPRQGLCCLKVAFLKEAPQKFSQTPGEIRGCLTNQQPTVVVEVDSALGFGHWLGSSPLWIWWSKWSHCRSQVRWLVG